ncbi:hypothetical protein ACFWP3_40450, partial [Streptomyces sp. NPDC058525]|uniref:hypothetical protein n=1 Tax=unclassified Streptomyces TaxID=2593676 RepID=UPI00364BBB64
FKGTSIHRSGTGYQLLALIFGTLLSSQGTDACFVLTLSGFPPGFRSVFLRFRLYQIISFAVSGLDLNSVTVGGSVPFGAPLR